MVTSNVVLLLVCLGLLHGHVLADCYMTSMAPPVLIVPLGLSVVCAFAGDQLSSNRPVLLAACIGAPLAVQLAIGLISGSLGFSYLLFAVASGAIYAVALQLTLADQQTDSVIRSAVLVAVTLITQAALTLVTSTTYEKASEAAAAQK